MLSKIRKSIYELLLIVLGREMVKVLSEDLVRSHFLAKKGLSKWGLSNAQ
jgi:hypothetical protein